MSTSQPHACPWPGCVKAYKRLDHLERHQKTHSGDLNYRCHVCHKQYSRSIACVDDRVACDGVPPKVCTRCREAARPCRYRHLEVEAQAVGAGPGLERRVSPPAGAAPKPLGWLDAGSSSGDAAPLASLVALGDAAEAVPRAATSPLASLFQPDEPWLTDLILSATGQAAYLAPAPAPVDWGFPDAPGDIFGPIGGPPSPHADLVGALLPSEVDGGEPGHIPDNGPRDSAWPNVYRPVGADSALLLEPVGEREPELGARARVTQNQRSMMLTLSMHAHSAMWARPDLGNFPSEAAISRAVNLYLSRFAAWLPVIDSPRGSFLVEKAPPLLLKAMAAVGSVYARDGLERLGLPLTELVRRDVAFICEHDQRFIYELAVVQATLLQGYYALFSGTPKLFQQAEIVRATLVTACKRMHLLDASVSAVSHVSREGGSEKELERALKQDHRYRRLGWGIILLDCQLACLFGVPAQYPFTEIACALPTLAPDGGPQTSFAATMSALLDKGTLVPQPLDDVAYSCLSYALYRLLLDAAAVQAFSSKRPEGGRYALAVPAYEIHPQALLDQLARHTLASATAPTPLLVSCAALAYHSHLQFTEVGFLDQVKIAAGRAGHDGAQQDAARRTLAGWMRVNHAATRNVFANAAMLSCLMSRFAFDTPPEVVWTFDAALCMWAVLRLSDVATASPAAPPLTISYAPTPELEGWIEHGDGAPSVQGFGRSARPTAFAMLQTSADRLEVMSWGLAARYRTVLLGLIAEVMDA
ncbi:hypothetical protein Q8F55_007837 [Vanrija albida]|uniref:C2H2-type domain-containing protein n=1 Tax=Vanrija albida TaxID=181172 RepID=A0ABR3PUN2_9TREE